MGKQSKMSAPVGSKIPFFFLYTRTKCRFNVFAMQDRFYASMKFSSINNHSYFFESTLKLKTNSKMITSHKNETLPKNPSNQYENVFNIEGFSSFEDITGRGVCIFYKEHLNVTILNKINDMYHPSIFMNIKYVNKSFNIGLVYRSPNNDFKENKKLKNQINLASKTLKNLVIFGDFNHPSIDWDYNSCNKMKNTLNPCFFLNLLNGKQ